MNREQILELCSRARDVGAIKHVDFAGYVIALESNRRASDEWGIEEHVYRAVDGKLAMANAVAVTKIGIGGMTSQFE